MTEKPRHLLDGLTVARYAGIATFLRTPFVEDLDEVDVGLVGVPIDHSATIRPGARHAPAAVRDMSRYVRPLNDLTFVDPFTLVRVGDIGDVPVDSLDYKKTLTWTENYFRNLRDHDVAPVAVGGDHSVTLPVLRGIRGHQPIGVVQFDAHVDSNDEMYGNKENHGTVMRRAVEEAVIDPHRVVQIGLRGGHYTLHDFDYARDAGFRIITFNEYEELGRAQVIEEIQRVIGDGPTYVTVDIDGLDPSQAPGTGLPVVGGLSVRDMQVMLRSLHGKDIIGGDVCEICPPFDVQNLTSLVGANLMNELLCLVAVAHAKRHGKPV